MSLELIIYLGEIVDGLKIFFCLSAVALVYAGMIYAISITELREYEIEKLPVYKKLRTVCLSFGFAFVVICILIPDQKVFYSIAGVTKAKEILENPQMKKNIEKSLELLELKIDKALDQEKK